MPKSRVNCEKWPSASFIRCGQFLDYVFWYFSPWDKMIQVQMFRLVFIMLHPVFVLG